MANTKRLPDDKTLAQHRKDGWTMRVIADHYGVTPKAVAWALREAGLTGTRPRYEDTLPWTVGAAHNQDWEAHMLRELGKKRAGKPAGHRGKYLDEWLQGLTDRNTVVDYDRERGFFEVPRADTDDPENYVRKPERGQVRPGGRHATE